MEHLREVVENYKRSMQKIFDAFGNSSGYGEIDLRETCKWNFRSGEVIWLEKDTIYSNEMLSEPDYCDGLMMVYVDNGCGDKYYQIFDMDLKDETIELDY